MPSQQAGTITDSSQAKRILEQVKQKLYEAPYLSLRNVECELVDGRLVLRGRVSTFYLKQIAQTAAMAIDEVNDIDNRLEVD